MHQRVLFQEGGGAVKIRDNGRKVSALFTCVHYNRINVICYYENKN